ncbi:hypothetical protein [Streptomyces aurantiacus]|uniref:hypothetical protein n=1 Tax=Streptomyces aurantiacus TaxID=47760 RepID=UPI0006E39044|nr:hypothetical protein [Streptomyces aurantiacus]
MHQQRQASNEPSDKGKGKGKAPQTAPRGPVAQPSLPGASLGTSPGTSPGTMLAMQQSAGNAAASKALRGRGPRTPGSLGSRQPSAELSAQVGESSRTVAGPSRTGRRPGPAGLPSISELPEHTPATRLTSVLPTIEEAEESAPPEPEPLGLPPYLRDLTAAGLSTARQLTGHEIVGTALAATVGHSGGTVAEIKEELAGRPESFYGQGRAFSVAGVNGKDWYDVTVTISPAPADRPETFVSADVLKARAKTAKRAGDRAAARAEMERQAEGAATKVDVQHNTSATVGHTQGNSASRGVGAMAFGLAPVVPGVWLGGAAMLNAQPFQSARESRTQKSVAEPRVLRSDKGSVELLRQVRYGVRIKKQEEAEEQSFSGSGTLTMRVPTEHLIPASGQVSAPRPAPLAPRTAKKVARADSLAPVAVTDTAAPHQGGKGLFDKVRSVLHPSLTSPGAPGRARLYDATSTSTVLEDMPRLLRQEVVGEDLTAKDGSAVGTYRMRAAIGSLAPAWGIGKTQLRTHQQAQHSVADTAGKGRGGTFGAGPAIGVGVLANAAAVRGTAMPTFGARSARFTVSEQTVSSRQGAEVRGEKVLYHGTVVLTVEGTGPLSPAMKARMGNRTATHSMNVWLSLRADEARELGLPLPQGVTADDMVKKPKADPGNDKDKDDKGTDKKGKGKEKERASDVSPEDAPDIVRQLPFGAMGSSVTLSKLDTGPMLSGIQRLFATDPQLAGYLPAFGAGREAGKTSPEDAEVQRRNYRELVTVLSETNLAVNKDQLLSSGIRVRMRRKSRMHAHDVQIKVTGRLGDTTYSGDIKDWLVRSHSGVTGNTQSGRSSSRSVGGLVLGQFRIIPGALNASLRADKTWTGGRRGQGGPTTRSDILTNGSANAAAFDGSMHLDVDVTMTTRERKAKRTLTPGAPGRAVPEARHIGSVDVEDQDVRLLTPTALTMDADEKEKLDNSMAARTAGHAPPQRTFAAEGIGDLAGMEPKAMASRRVRDWTLVETLGDGQPIRDLAFELLASAAARNKALREDKALATEGLAPRLAIEERFSPQAVTAALRQAVSAGWVVKNLRYARRTAGLNGAVGTRLALANPKVVQQTKGAGTETFVLGGHQATGQESDSTSTSVQGGVLGMENGSSWRAGEGVSASRTLSEGSSTASTLSGTVERNSHTARDQSLYLVHCDLVVRMVAEVGVTGGGPYVAKSERTLPGAAAVWLTADQLRASKLRVPGAEPETGKQPAKAESKAERKAESKEESSKAGAERERLAAGAETGQEGRRGTGAPAPGPQLSRDVPLGFGAIEDLPDFVPLLDQLRGSLGRRDKSLAENLLPRQQLKDRNDNVQRLLRVLDRDGAAGLLSGAMDGGVTVELMDGRSTPYWAVFKVDRSGPGTYAETVADGVGDMEYITSAAAQRAGSQEKSDSRGVEAVFAGAGKPEGGGGQLKNVGGSGGLGLGRSDGRKTASAGRAQIGVKAVADASAHSVRMNVPITASLELHSAKGRLGLAEIRGQKLTHRILQHDLTALARLQPVPREEREPQVRASPGREDARADRMGPWHDGGVALPMEAQVNGFKGAPEIRRLIDGAVREANGSKRYSRKGDAAAHVQQEAVSTEWLISALPLLTSAGVDLPPVHASGVRGQDLRTALHGRLRDGRVLGVGDKMTFETVAQSSLDAPRPTGVDSQQSAEHSRTARGIGGAGVLNATEFRMNQLLGNADSTGSATDTAANAAGSMPLHKPKLASVLVQFTLDVRVVARVTDRGLGGQKSVAVREFTLPRPVVIRMPAPAVSRLLKDPTNASKLQDPQGLLTEKKANAAATL